MPSVGQHLPAGRKKFVGGQNKASASRPIKLGYLIDNSYKIRTAFRAGKKTVVLNGRVFGMRKITRETTVVTKAHPEGVKVLEHWLSVFPVDGKGDYPRANLEYPHVGANSRGDLL